MKRCLLQCLSYVCATHWRKSTHLSFSWTYNKHQDGANSSQSPLIPSRTHFQAFQKVNPTVKTSQNPQCKSRFIHFYSKRLQRPQRADVPKLVQLQSASVRLVLNKRYSKTRMQMPCQSISKEACHLIERERERERERESSSLTSAWIGAVGVYLHNEEIPYYLCCWSSREQGVNAKRDCPSHYSVDYKWQLYETNPPRH